MNKPCFDFYFDFISPYSYLAATRIQEIEARYNIPCNWLPINLPRLMKLSGNSSPVSVKNKAIYSLRDLKRWARHLDLPFKMIRPGSFDSRPALAISSALAGEQRAEFNLAIFDSLWSGAVNSQDTDWLLSIFQIKGLPQEWLQLQSESFESYTRDALKAGAFGAPTFVLHPVSGRSELFFGMDHLDFLKRACATIETKN